MRGHELGKLAAGSTTSAPSDWQAGGPRNLVTPPYDIAFETQTPRGDFSSRGVCLWNWLVSSVGGRGQGTGYRGQRRGSSRRRLPEVCYNLSPVPCSLLACCSLSPI